MAQDKSGLQQANDQMNRKREDAKEQGLAEKNVTGASPPPVEKAGPPAQHELPSTGNGPP